MPNENPVLPTYSFNLPDPTDAVRKNLELAIGVQQSQRQAQAAQQEAQLKGVQIQAAQQGLQQQQLATHQQQVAMDQQRQLYQDFASLPHDLTAGDIAGLVKRNPTQYAKIKEIYDSMHPAEMEARQNLFQPIMAAMISKDPVVVQNKIGEAYTALKNSGKADQADQMLKLGQSYNENPFATLVDVGGKMATAMGPDKFAQVYGKITGLPTAMGTEQAALDKAQSDATIGKSNANFIDRKNQGELDTGALGRQKTQQEIDQATKMNPIAVQKAQAEADKLTREAGGGLTDDGKKQYVDSITALKSGRATISKIDAILPEFKSGNVPSGVIGRAAKYFDSITGANLAKSGLQQQFSDLANGSVISQLQSSGRVTPAEINQFLQGIPPETAGPDQKAAWLSTLRKFQGAANDLALEQTQYIKKNGDLTPVKKPFKIGEKQYNVGDDAPGVQPSTSDFKPSADDIARARKAINHPGADPQLVASAKAKFKLAGVSL